MSDTTRPARVRNRDVEVNLPPMSLSLKHKRRFQLFHAEERSHLSQNALMVEALIEYMDRHNARMPTQEELK